MAEHRPVARFGLRQMVDADADFVARLHRAAMPLLYAAPLPGEAEPRVLVDVPNARIIQVHLVGQSDLVDPMIDVGLLWLAFDAETCTIHRLLIHPDWQHKGVGTEILVGVLYGAYKQGVQACVRLPKNSESRPFFERYGFAAIGADAGYVELRCDPSVFAP